MAKEIKKLKKAHIGVGIAVALVLLTGVFFGYQFFRLQSAPAKYLEESLEKTKQVIQNKLEKSPFQAAIMFSKYLDTGSLTLDLGDISYDKNKMLRGLQIESKLDSKEENKEHLLYGAIKFGSLSLLEGELYVSPEQISVGLPSRLGFDKHLGIYLKTWKEQLNQSVFAPEQRSDYSITEKRKVEFTKASDWMEYMLNEKPYRLDKIWEETEELRSEIFTAVEPKIEKKETVIEEKTVKAMVVSYHFSEEIIKELHGKIYDFLLNHEYFKTLYAIDGQEDYEKRKEKMEQDKKEFQESFQGEIDWDIYFNSNREIIKLEQTEKIRKDGVEHNRSFCFTFGAKPLESERWTLERRDGDGVTTAVLEQKEKENKMYSTLLVTRPEKKDVQLDTEWVPKTGELKIVWKKDTNAENGKKDQIQMDGSLLVEDKNGFTLQIEKIAVETEKRSREITMNLTIGGKDSVEVKKPEMEDILTLTEEGVKKMMEQLKKLDIMSIFSKGM